MLYTLFVFTFGIYVGQEYPDVPNVRLTFNNAMKYVKQQTEEKNGSESGTTDTTTGHVGVPGSSSVPKSAVDFWKSFFEKPKDD